ncbi:MULTISPECIES: transglutaminase family protein [Okeania]|uniref:Transglutaminase family protein n=2 Tax=Okeania TaxID=1458928 RepID=A0A3N6NV04_9CYAN|nr:MULTISPECIES: transglutaminase family protein [Okeania]NES77981.1 transglutaminase family protein [Okeania sp. SIO1H4]NET22510.1 transglutaminase family protein [Okeania sp. SIO1H5]NET75321.1 transglutaminase family protein [Okeania sp. SIO1F9]NET96539.1 transglutaminase family protein [Okeania sp. SIO1H2]RQH20520.1 transglutaminase family protein [Okeania hirsuta]
MQKQYSGPRTIRPIGVASLHSIAFSREILYAIDKNRGFLLEIDPKTDNTTVINPFQTNEFIDVTGLALWKDTLWLTRENEVYFCLNAIGNSSEGRRKWQHFFTLPYPADGIAVWESTVYVTCQKLGKIFVLDKNTRQQITGFYAPGIGFENITVQDEELWLCDREEQTVYCLERATGKVKFSVLTPFESPTGLAFYLDINTGERQLYVAYAGDELYIRDDPNSEKQYELSKRDRSFIHPLYFYYNEQEKYAVSNVFLIEMSYVEELEPLDEVFLEDLEWRIALPSETHRQKVREISPIGIPFTEEIQNGEKVAVFRFKPLRQSERRIFGWKALLEVRAIKYQIQPFNVENIPELPEGFQEKYLVDNDNLAMDKEIVIQAAKDAILQEKNLLRQLLNIRNYVYDRLSYGVTTKIDTPDIVLERGVGSCGEYVGLLLALARLNNIACRTVGRYKCPAFADRKSVPLEPEFNHVWLEFYLPGFGWVPMESNPDDLQEGGPYPLRFFMGLAWYHVEIGKGIKFETLKSKGIPVNKEKISIGNLAINHVRFTILEERPGL